MFKNAERISKIIDQMIKLTAELEHQDRKNELTIVIHELAKLQQNVLGDLRVTNK